MNEWVEEQVASFRQLAGRTIVRWIGIEMALRESGPDGLPRWEDESVPLLQLSRLDLDLAGGDGARIVTYQNDDRWGLSRRDELPAISAHDGEGTGIFRRREIDAVPIGPVQDVLVVMDEGDISEVHLCIAGHCVALRAGEVDEANDGTLTIVGMDESILLQVDGRKPGPRGSRPPLAGPQTGGSPGETRG